MIHSKARVKSGETVVVTAGAGGVGGFAVQFAHLAGCRVIATSTAQNFQYLRSIGADETVDYTHEDVVARVQQLTHGRGADFWIELVGPESAASAFQALAFNGMLVSAVGSPNISTALKQGELFHRGQGLFSFLCLLLVSLFLPFLYFAFVYLLVVCSPSRAFSCYHWRSIQCRSEGTISSLRSRRKCVGVSTHQKS